MFSKLLKNQFYNPLKNKIKIDYAQSTKIFEIKSETHELKYLEGVKKQLKNKKIEIFSYRGRFTEQAKKREKFFLSGKLECVIVINSTRKQGQNYFRIILGDQDDKFYLI